MSNLLNRITINDIINYSNSLDSDIYCKPGDYIQLDTMEFNVFGLLTTSRTELLFSFPVFKSLKYINNISFTTLGVIARISDGGYLFENKYYATYLDLNKITLVWSKSAKTITVHYIDSSAFLRHKNNQVLDVVITTGTRLNFS